VIYSSLMGELKDQGIIFLSTDEALQKHPEFFDEYFGKVIPANDNKFSALNSAVWSGGSFLYIPKGVKVERPLQAYFRINAIRMGQFERTLIIADEGSEAQYVEGCSSPVYSEDSLHAAVVEVIVKKGARFRYTTVQNWFSDVYNLVTKRARVEEDGIMEWVDCNIGSKLTMKYPSCYLVGERARGELLSIAYAGKGQHQDAGAKMLHIAPNTSSRIVSKSISVDGGRTSYRGMVTVAPTAKNAKSRVECDALILDSESVSDTFPVMRIDESSANIEHEATVSKIGEEKLFYLMSRGLNEEEAMSLIVSGFIEPVVKELPLEYAVEMNRLIELEMEGSVG
jgi:Fe-S cluster assembly protein SufB